MTYFSSEQKRSSRPSWVLAAAATVLAGSIGARASAVPGAGIQSPDPAAQSPAKALQDEEAFALLGEETTEKVCIVCHPWENITRTRRTLRDWDIMVVSMAARGAQGTEEQFTTVKKFLTRYYGMVRVNTAPAAEIAAVLGLTAKDAAAVVEYRKANGKFADTTALGKVSPIVKSKVDEQPEAVIFE